MPHFTQIVHGNTCSMMNLHNRNSIFQAKMIRQYGHVLDLATRSSTVTCIKSISPHPLTFSISALVTTSIPFAYNAEVGLLVVKFLTWIQFNFSRLQEM